jgi:hypothetical protein
MEHLNAKTDDDTSVADDRLEGAVEIAAETGDSVAAVYRKWAAGQLVGVYKLGHRLVGSRSAIRRAHRLRAARSK